MSKIRYNKVRFNDGEDLFIHPIGDMHIGHINCNMDFLTKQLENIPLSSNHRILLMGDLVDCGTKSSVGASGYEQKLNPNEQLNTIVKMFCPFREQIDGVVQGNHEYRIMKESGIDIMEQFCNQLDIPYLLYSGVVTYSLGKKHYERAYNINMIHGNAGGNIGNVMMRCKGMSNKITADVYLMGHAHYNMHSSRVMKYVDSRNEKLIERKQYFVLTGHTLDYDDSYADKANLEISPMGFPTIILSANGKKEVTII